MNMDTNKKPILITGSHRSGSTWVGKMIGLSSQVGYIWEPFNIKHRPGICSAKFEHWFQYVNHENGALYEKALRDCISFRYNLPAEMKALSSIKDVGRLIRDVLLFSLYRARKSRPLLKDPIAFLSAGWLAETFDMDVVVIIRHPAAFAGSLKKANWEFPFSHLLSQPLLMSNLTEFERDIEEYSTKKRDFVDQASLLWNIVHSVVLRYKRTYPDWIYVRHEDLSKDPVNGFKEIYRTLGIDFDASIEQTILEYTSANNPREQESMASVRRDSLQNIQNWKRRLSTDEIERVRKNTKEISSQFYSDTEW